VKANNLRSRWGGRCRGCCSCCSSFGKWGSDCDAIGGSFNGGRCGQLSESVGGNLVKVIS
jgi:hypothetical protein